jgi:hypothetical protein
MAGKNTAAFGIYNDQEGVERAVDALKANGYRNTDISVLFPENSGTKDFAHEKHTKAPEGATTGAGSGVVLGGTLGWLAGIGALAIPGLGPFIAAGPIMAALAGAGVGGAVGGLVGALVGMGIPEYEANGTRAGSRAAVFFSQYIVTTRSGRRRQDRFWKTLAPKTSHLLVSPRRISPNRTGEFSDPMSQRVTHCLIFLVIGR